MMVGVVVLASTAPCMGQALLPNWPEPNGPVHAIVEDTAQGVVFVGGGFDRIGPPLRGGVPLDRTTGQPVLSAPRPNGDVRDVVPDGNGGYFLAGAFTAVDGQARRRIAHIDANGQLLPFDPSNTAGLEVGAVDRLLLHDGVLYAAHSVSNSTQVTTPKYNGAVDATSGEPIWDQALTDGAIRDAIPDGQGGWYIVGDFQHVGGQRREGLARIGANGAVHPWYVPVNGPVNTLHRTGDTLYIAGCFSNVLGQDRQYLAGLVLSTNELLPLQTNFTTSFGLYCAVPSHVFRLGARLYVRGEFEWMSQFDFYNEGWLDATTGATATAPFTINAPIDDVLHTDDRILIAGSFTQFNASSQASLAVFDRATYALVPGQVTITGGGVDGLERGDGVIYLRGSFTAINGQPRAGLAAIDATTLALLPWAPQVNGAVHAFTFGEGVLHMRGSFTAVNGQARSGAAAIDQSGTLLSWAPALGSLGAGADVFVRQGDRVLMALPPQSAITAASHRVFALDGTSGEPTGWMVQVEGGEVDDLQRDEDHLFLAGSFTSLQGQQRGLVGRVALADATLDGWNAQITGSRVRRLELVGGNVYVIGSFSTIGGLSRTRMAVVSRSTALPQAYTFLFTPQAGQGSPFVADLKAAGDTLYFIGTFGSVNGVARNGFAALRASTGALVPWPVNHLAQGITDPLVCLEVSGDTVFVGGNFRQLVASGPTGTMGYDRYHLAAIDRHSGSLIAPFAPTFGTPQRLNAVGPRLFVLGEVSWTSGSPRGGVAALAITTGSVLPFEIDVQGEVQTLAISAGALYLGGPFTAINGLPVPGVARVDASTGALLPFAQSIPWGGQRYAFEVHQGRLFMGTSNGMAVYDAVTGAPLSWSHQPNGPVRALDLLADRIYIGGSFTQIGGVPRTGSAAVDLSVSVLTSWNPGLPITALAATASGVALVRPTGELVAVDTEQGQVLPVVRPFSDIDLPSAAVVVADEELLIMASGAPLNVTSTFFSDLESYHLPTGGRTAFAQGQPRWARAENDSDIPDNSYVSRMVLGAEQLYVSGAFMTIGGERRHNLAVFSRPIQELVQLDLRASLGGIPQVNGLLNDALRAQALLPAQEPYTRLGFPQHLFGGGEGAESPVFAVADSTAVVDWVLVELRNASDPTEVLATRNGLLRRDGRVVDVDGRSTLSFPLPTGAYHVALHHRNHLGAMTAVPVSLGRSATTVDLRTGPGYGSEGQLPTSGGHALWPGDATGDRVVKYAGADNDRDAVLLRLGGNTPTTVIVGAYDGHDINLDGIIRYTGANNDRDIILQTIGGSVPTAVRVGQVP